MAKQVIDIKQNDKIISIELLLFGRRNVSVEDLRIVEGKKPRKITISLESTR